MFNDLFDFAKPRDLKQSVGFYLFYLCMFFGVTGLLSIMGVQ